jgi:hypothetical protein
VAERQGVLRRSVLRAAGGFAVLLVGGGVWRAWNQGVFSTDRGPAFEPWRNWRQDQTTTTVALVRAAILAANPHNTQPWLFHVTDSRIDLFADTKRNIGTIDPYFREMYTGLGCALENLLLAARANGYAAKLELMPTSSDAKHAARIDLTPGEKSAVELYEAIPNRHTNRGPYDLQRGVRLETLEGLAALGDDNNKIFWFTSVQDRRRVGEVIIRASEALVADQDQSHDSAQWLRFRWGDVQRSRDGLTIDAIVSSPMMRSAAKVFPPRSTKQADQFWLKATQETVVATAAGFGILAVRDASNHTERLRGGRVWQRMQLWATTRGLALHPQSQPTERADRERSLGIEGEFGTALADLVGDSNWQALMTFRFGYPMEKAALSPRRPLEAVFI